MWTRKVRGGGRMLANRREVYADPCREDATPMSACTAHPRFPKPRFRPAHLVAILPQCHFTLLPAAGEGGGASTEAVKIAFKAQAMLLHPDRYVSAPEDERKQVGLCWVKLRVRLSCASKLFLFRLDSLVLTPCNALGPHFHTPRLSRLNPMQCPGSTLSHSSICWVHRPM